MVLCTKMDSNRCLLVTLHDVFGRALQTWPGISLHDPILTLTIEQNSEN